jgi:putative membrane protein
VSVAAASASIDFWRWHPHPEVWTLVVGLVVLATYAVRVIGPKAVPAGESPMPRAQKAWFAVGIVLLWAAADWPMHDIGETYLYSVHMVQHFLLTFVIPPIFLMATPEWLARLVLGKGRVNRWVHTLAKPIPACVIFNAIALALHMQIVVNNSVTHAWLHYTLHTLVVTAALLLWMPVCGPLPELRIALPAQMVYLFVTSIIPTVPGAWLTFAEGAVYSAYDKPARLFGISVTQDQQAAGIFMKLGAGGYLWTIITMVFFRWASRHEAASAAGVDLSEHEVLTWAEVSAELDRLGPAPYGEGGLLPPSHNPPAGAPPPQPPNP